MIVSGDSKRRKKVRLFLTSTLIITLLAICVISKMRMSTARLTDQATVLFSCKNIVSDAPEYCVSDKNIVFFRDIDDPYIYDLSTKKEKSLVDLRQVMLDSDEGIGGMKLPFVELSPDGRYILWANTHGAVFASSLDGQFHFETRDYWFDKFCWLSTNKEWMIYGLIADDEGGLKRYGIGHLAKPHISQPHALYIPEPVDSMEYTLSNLVCASEHCMALSDYSEPSSFSQDHIDVYVFDPDNSASSVCHRIKIPKDAHIKAAVISPHCDQILLELLYDNDGSMNLSFIRSLLDKLGLNIKDHSHVALYTASLTTGQLHNLGEIILDSTAISKIPNCLRWFPNEDRISFVYEAQVWMLPVSKP